MFSLGKEFKEFKGRLAEDWTEPEVTPAPNSEHLVQLYLLEIQG